MLTKLIISVLALITLTTTTLCLIQSVTPEITRIKEVKPSTSLHLVKRNFKSSPEEVPAPKEITEPEYQEPVEVIAESHELEPVHITTEYIERIYEPCGCHVLPQIPIRLTMERPDTLEKQNLLPDLIEIDPYIFEPIAYPNPTTQFSTVAFETKDEDHYEIALYTMNGQLIQTYHSGLLYPGRQQFEVDLSDQSTGLFIVHIYSKNQAETLKIQKI